MKTGKTKIGLIGLGLIRIGPNLKDYTHVFADTRTGSHRRCPVGTLKSLTPELLITR